MLINDGFRNFPFQLLEGNNSRLGYRDPDFINIGIFGRPIGN